MRSAFLVRLLVGVVASSMCVCARAQAARGYVVTWFYLASAVSPVQKDCPHGLNPSSEANFVRWLRDMGKSPAEIKKLLVNFPDDVRPIATMRGRIDGKPVDAYVNPASTRDPHLKMVRGRYAYGFDLDGRADTGGFINPDTGERGVDNQLFRALGCIGSERGEPGLRPTHTAGQWEAVRLEAAAWLVEISGLSNPANDGDVTVKIFRATTPVFLDALGRVQRDATFVADPNPATTNVVHGRVKDGVLTTDVFGLHMISFRYSILPRVDMTKARLRLKLDSDGSIAGYVGGYFNWVTLYSGFARRGANYETGVGLDVPAIYYLLRKSADADPDPRTGQNREISATFDIQAVPAFIVNEGARDHQSEVVGVARQ